MRRFIFAVGLLLAAVFLPAQVLDMPVAVVRLTETVNVGRRTLTSQLDLFAAQLGRELSSDEKRQILDALIDDELLLQGAARANIRVTQQEISNYLDLQRQQWSQMLSTALTEQQFRQQVERQTGSSWQEFVEDVTDELIKLKYVQQEKSGQFADIQPSSVEVEQFYEEQATSFTNPAMVRFEHIYIDLRGKSEAERSASRTRIVNMRRQVRDGVATFDTLLRASADDPSYSASDFGYLLRNDPRNQSLLGRSFIDSVFSLADGAVSEVLESNVALHIVHIIDKRGPRILGLDDPLLPGQNLTVRQQIQRVLAGQKEQEVLALAVEDLVQELRAEAETTVFEQNLPW